jgi:hypothetical protein
VVRVFPYSEAGGGHQAPKTPKISPPFLFIVSEGQSVCFPTSAVTGDNLQGIIYYAIQSW